MLVLIAILTIIAVAGVLDAAVAQTSPFGGARPVAPPAQVGGVVGWLLAKQAEFYRAMSGLIRAAKVDGTAVWGLLGLSFLYGIFHAAGPGHGKAVISSYLLANEETWRRGIALSFASALLQALVAVALVGVAAIALNATAKTMNDTVRVIEIVSYALIALLGARLTWAKGRAFMRALRDWRSGQAAGAPDHAHEHAARDHSILVHAHHSHDHAHHAHAHHEHARHEHAHPEHATAAHSHRGDMTVHHEGADPHHSHDHSHDHLHDHDHDHGHDHDHAAHVHDDHCGHSHGPDPQDLGGRGGWQRGLSAIVAVGLRPCSGAILVLVFALAQGLFWAGVASTFVMGLGTAITVATIATFAVGAKSVARQIAAHRAGGGGVLAMRGIEAAAALLVLVSGVALLAGYMVTERMI